ncbi:MAG: hypothetical protein ACOCWQ_00650 [Nanoarchaeota archaeon]
MRIFGDAHVSQQAHVEAVRMVFHKAPTVCFTGDMCGYIGAGAATEASRYVQGCAVSVLGNHDMPINLVDSPPPLRQRCCTKASSYIFTHAAETVWHPTFMVAEPGYTLTDMLFEEMRLQGDDVDLIRNQERLQTITREDGRIHLPHNRYCIDALFRSLADLTGNVLYCGHEHNIDQDTTVIFTSTRSWHLLHPGDSFRLRANRGYIVLLPHLRGALRSRIEPQPDSVHYLECQQTRLTYVRRHL